MAIGKLLNEEVAVEMVSVFESQANRFPVCSDDRLLWILRFNNWIRTYVTFFFKVEFWNRREFLDELQQFR